MRKLAHGHVRTVSYLKIMTQLSFNLNKTDLKIVGAAQGSNESQSERINNLVEQSERSLGLGV